MCGLAGYFGKNKLNQEIINRTISLMKNRGPDSQANIHFQAQNNNINFLHARLAIIDLDPRSNQPFDIGPYSLIFVGEIYNYLELRQNLINRGIQLRTESDTEVLLHYYILFGEKCVDHFEGMWAFVIYDRPKNQLFLSRDRFGEKPLYYIQDQSGFYFGSEIKFIRSLIDRKLEVNQQHLLRYMVNGYKSLYKTKETFYKEIKEVAAGSNLIINADLQAKQTRYWQPQTKVDQNMSFEAAVEGFKERFNQSIKIRLRADVPLAFCLSGGVDSSSIASVAQKSFGCDVVTFSIIDQDPRYNELENIQATINDLKCKHHLIHLNTSGFFERLKKLVSYHDAPVATVTYYVHSLITEAIGKEGYKVSFSGTSADELLTGYYDHYLMHLAEVRNLSNYQEYLQAWQTHIKPNTRNPKLQDPNSYVNNPNFRENIYLDRAQFLDTLKCDFKEDFYETNYCPSLLRNRMLNELFEEITPVILHEDDLNSMLYSIENRSPYLDTNLFNFCYSIPVQHLIKDGYAKYILRSAMKGILNDQVRLDRKKKGFNASMNTLVNFQDKQTREYLLDNSPIYDLVDKSKIEKIFNQNPLSDSFNKFVFSFINAKMFLENN